MNTHVTQTQKVTRGYLGLLIPNGHNMHNWSLYPHTLIFIVLGQKDIGVWTHTDDPNLKWSSYAQLVTVST